MGTSVKDVILFSANRNRLFMLNLLLPAARGCTSNSTRSVANPTQLESARKNVIRSGSSFSAFITFLSSSLKSLAPSRFIPEELFIIL